MGNYDLEMIRELLLRDRKLFSYFDGRAPGSRPFCLIDYFLNDF